VSNPLALERSAPFVKAALVRIAEDDQHQPVPVRGDADKMLATMHDELPDCRFARPSKRVSQNSIASSP